MAFFPGEVATVAALKQGFRTNAAGDTDVRSGGGTTLGTIDKSGGNLELYSSFTTLTQSGGETVVGAGAPTTMHVRGGQMRYRSSGNFGTANVASGGELDFRQDMRSRTGTNCNLYAGAILRDPLKTLTVTNGLRLNNCALGEITLDLGNDLTLTRS